MNINITTDITTDITVMPKANKTYKEKYCIYISFSLYNKGIKQNTHMVSTGININKAEWEHGKVIGKNDMAKLYNERINEYLTNAKRMVEDLRHKKIKTAGEAMKEIKANGRLRITGKACKGGKDEYFSRLKDYDYLTIMNKYLAFAKPCDARKLKYNVPYKKLLEYFENDLPTIDNLTSEDMEDFKFWLIDYKRLYRGAMVNYKHNTITSYCCMIASVFNYAKKMKLITDNHLPKGFGGSFITGIRDIVTDNEIMAINNLSDIDLPSGVMKAKYTLLLQSTTGLGIKEMKSIEYQHLKTECINGKNVRYIQKNRTKTDVEFMVVLSTNAITAMNKLIEMTGNEDRPFNLCSDSKINRHYRTLAGKAGITKNVAPYQFRHAFAVDYMNNDGRLEDLQKMLGHKDISTTGIYGTISLKRLSEKTDLLESKSIIHKQYQPLLKAV